MRHRSKKCAMAQLSSACSDNAENHGSSVHISGGGSREKRLRKGIRSTTQPPELEDGFHSGDFIICLTSISRSQQTVSGESIII